jgi:hypothetical protein
VPGRDRAVPQRAPEAELSLLCRLGRHRPRGIPRWNDGYYFATCERCGSDLVRTAFERWHVPSGYRVVWSDRPPVSRPEVALMPEESSAAAPVELAQAPDPAPDVAIAGPVPDPPADPAVPAQPAEIPPQAPPEALAADTPLAAEAPASSAEPRGGRLPIQDVLARLHADDAAGRAPEAAPVPDEVAPQRRRSTWDFMEDDSSGKEPAWGLAPAGTAAQRSPDSGPSATVDSKGEADPAPRGPGRMAERWLGIRSAIRNFWSGPAEPNAVVVIGLALAVAVGTALALALALPSSEPSSGAPAGPKAGVAAGGAGEEPDPFAASEPAAAQGEAGTARPGDPDKAASERRGDRAYVAASLLSCRSAPALEAKRVRNLSRGQEVRVLGIEGDWASLAYRGGQCWARAHYISPVPPL